MESNGLDQWGRVLERASDEKQRQLELWEYVSAIAKIAEAYPTRVPPKTGAEWAARLANRSPPVHRHDLIAAVRDLPMRCKRVTLADICEAIDIAREERHRVHPEAVSTDRQLEEPKKEQTAEERHRSMLASRIMMLRWRQKTAQPEDWDFLMRQPTEFLEEEATTAQQKLEELDTAARISRGFSPIGQVAQQVAQAVAAPHTPGEPDLSRQPPIADQEGELGPVDEEGDGFLF